MLDYFLRRLGSSQVASRVLAMKVRPLRAPHTSASRPEFLSYTFFKLLFYRVLKWWLG